MTLIRRHSDNYPTLSNLFEDIFANDFLDNTFNRRNVSVPSVNISELEDKYKIELAAPGFKKDDFNIDLDNNVLTISSETEDKTEEEKSNFTKREFHYSSFKRSFTLPEVADAENIAAAYKDGILSIEIKKKDEAIVKPKRNIEIK